MVWDSHPADRLQSRLGVRVFSFVGFSWYVLLQVFEYLQNISQIVVEKLGYFRCFLEVRLLRETIDSQHTDICRLNRNIDRLNADLRKRDKCIKELEERLAKHETPSKNSGNSNTPPSKENIKAEAIRRTKTLRKPTGRKSGG